MWEITCRWEREPFCGSRELQDGLEQKNYSRTLKNITEGNVCKCILFGCQLYFQVLVGFFVWSNKDSPLGWGLVSTGCHCNWLLCYVWTINKMCPGSSPCAESHRAADVSGVNYPSFQSNLWQDPPAYLEWFLQCSHFWSVLANCVGEC